MRIPKQIKNIAILYGLDSVNKTVYSEIISIHDYYDGEHCWDDNEKIKKAKIKRIRGFLFDNNGKLFQEFESIYDENGNFDNTLSKIVHYE